MTHIQNAAIGLATIMYGDVSDCRHAVSAGRDSEEPGKTRRNTKSAAGRKGTQGRRRRGQPTMPARGFRVSIATMTALSSGLNGTAAMRRSRATTGTATAYSQARR
jgi:hypothetical protein